MKNIMMIATGGTIACIDSGNGLIPQINPVKVLQFVPEIEQICQVDIVQPFVTDSSNMYEWHWLKIAAEIEKNYKDYDGFVILHGTDTMAYTAAALSYLIQNINKPVILTGAQQPIDKSISDGKINLLDSFLYAVSSDAKGVVIIFNGKVIAGTRARKVRTKSYNAFSSIDFPEIAVIQDGHIIQYIDRKKTEEEPIFYHDMCNHVFPIKLIPGMKPDILYLLQEHYDALIIESFGVGGIPEYDEMKKGYDEAIESWMAAGKFIIVTTQVPHEGSDMAVYKVGFRIKEKYEVIEAYDMTLEATVTKLMWILAQTRERENVKELFYRPVNFDILRQ